MGFQYLDAVSPQSELERISATPDQPQTQLDPISTAGRSRLKQGFRPPMLVASRWKAGGISLKVSESDAEAELSRVYQGMRKWWLIIVGIWCVSALFVVLCLMVWDIAHQLEPEGLPLAFDIVLGAACVVVSATAGALTRMLWKMMPRQEMKQRGIPLWPFKERSGWKSAWDRPVPPAGRVQRQK